MRQIESKKEMTEFFERNLEKGEKAEEIYYVLLNQGYPKSLINQGYNEAMMRINKRKESQRQKEAESQQKPVEIEPVVEERKGFFGKLFKKK